MAENRPGSDIVLPSLGLGYDSKIPDGKMTVYSMTTKQEKMFSGLNRRQDVEKVIGYLIAQCSNIASFGVDPQDLLIGDRAYLMMRIRAASYGRVYSMRARCTECNKLSNYQVDLIDDLTVTYADQNTWRDPFELKLPVSGDTIKLRLLTGTDQMKIINYHDQILKTVKNPAALIGDPSYIYNMALHVCGVDSESKSRQIASDTPTVLPEALKYCEELLSMDSSAIRDEIDRRTPGVSLLLNLDCNNPDCHQQFEAGMTMTADFFRTASAR